MNFYTRTLLTFGQKPSQVEVKKLTEDKGNFNLIRSGPKITVFE